MAEEDVETTRTLSREWALHLPPILANFLPFSGRVAQSMQRTRIERAQAFVEGTIDIASITEDDLVQLLESKPGSRDVFYRALNRVVETEDADYREVLSRVAALATDEARVSVSDYIASEIAALSPVAWRCYLAFFQFFDKDHRPVSSPGQADHAFHDPLTIKDLYDELGTYRELAYSVAQQLEMRGLVLIHHGVPEPLENEDELDFEAEEDNRLRPSVREVELTDWGIGLMFHLFPNIGSMGGP